MRHLIPAGLPDAEQLQPALARIAERGFAHIGDCVVFLGERDNRNEFPDSTGYECFANHIHVDDFLGHRSPESLVEQAIALAISLNPLLAATAPNSAFRYIVSVDSDGGCSFRFHSVRAGQDSMADDLELYQEEAIAVIESADLQSSLQ